MRPVQTSGALNGRTRGEARMESAKIGSRRKEMSNSTTAPEPIIELRNVTRRFDDNGFIAVDNFNLSIERGEFVTFLGPSG